MLRGMSIRALLLAGSALILLGVLGTATWLSVELTDIIASLVGLAAAVGFLRFWKPEGAAEALATLHADRDAELASMTEKERAALPKLHADRGTAHLDGGRIFMALFPYLLVIAVFSVTKLIDPVKNWMASTDIKIKVGRGWTAMC